MIAVDDSSDVALASVVAAFGSLTDRSLAMFSAGIRKLIQLWLAISVVVFATNLVPVLARFRSEGLALIDHELERRQPPAPQVDHPADSPWPTATIRMRGRAIDGLDDRELPSASLSFTPNSQQLAVTFNRVFLVDAPNAKLIRAVPTSTDKERFYCGAISGDESVIATVGEHTLVKFWDARNGKLIEALDDNDPTIAAQPDLNAHSQKHTNKLRYSEMGARRLVAAPGGCLFAMGKVDGSIELWGPVGEERPTGPSKLTEVQQQKTVTRRFQRLARSQPHTGEVLWMAFTRDCQSLVSLSGSKVSVDESREVSGSEPQSLRRFSAKDSKPLAVRSRVPSNDVMWSAPLADIPSSLAMDEMSQEFEGKGLLYPPRFAVADYSRNVVIRKLETGEVLRTIDTKPEGGHGMLASVAFGNGGTHLWTIGTRYDAAQPGESKTVTLVSAWEIARGKRIATAQLAGQVHAAEWNRHGMKVVMLRYVAPASGGLEQAKQWQLPWELPPPSPFMLHLWDVQIDQR